MCWEVFVLDRNEYLEIVSAQIRCKRAVPYLRGELEDHIEDQKDAYIAEGMTSFEAERAAVREMGDPVKVGVQLNQVHKPKMEWKILLGAVVLGIIGIILQVSVVIAVGNPNYIYETNRQTVFFLSGIVIMLIACYVDYSILAKYARVLWWGLVGLLFLSCVCGVPILYRAVNGVNRIPWLIAYFMVPIYPAFVYSWRNQGKKGFLMSLLGLVLFIVILRFDMPLGWMAKYCVVGCIVFGYAIYKNWFRIKKADIRAMAKYGACVFGGGVVCFIHNVIDYGYYDFPFVPQYYRERLEMFLSGTAKDYIAEEIKVYLHNGGNQAESQFLQEYMQNDYIWLFITEHLGKMEVVLIVALLVAFIFFLLHKVSGQKNVLGKVIATSCVMFLIIEMLFYIGGNLGLTPFIGSFMPFFGKGKAVTCITYFYIGILLSIFRNTNVVRN